MINKRFTKNKILFKSSLVILAFLIPINGIKAESANDESELDIVEMKEIIDTENELIDILTEEEKTAYYSLYDNDIVSELLSEGVEYYGVSNFEQTENSFIHILELDGLSKLQEIVIEKLINELPKESDINSKVEREQVESISLMSVIPTADEIYHEAMSTGGATPAWNAALKLKGLYPQDPRVNDVIHTTGRRQLILGMSNHRKQEFGKANEYYNRILRESAINQHLRRETEFYLNQSIKKQSLRTADDLYEEAMNAAGATPAWNAAQQLKEFYPEYPRLTTAINATANRQLILGMSRHREGNFKGTKEYYERILGEQLVSETLKRSVIIYKNQADNHQILLTAEDLYKEALNSSGATPAWNAAQKLKDFYPEDSRITEAINATGRRQLILGMTNHRQRNFKKASEYYERILNDSFIDNQLQKETKYYQEQALSNRTIRTADDLYEEAMTASGATPAWNAAQELKEIFSNDSRISVAIQNTANRQLILGMSNHKNKNFVKATEYYERILMESLTNKITRETTVAYLNQAQNGLLIRTPEEIYNEVMTASGETPAWNRAQELKRTFPSSSFAIDAVNIAAERMFILGKNSHIKKDFKQALYYYDKILDEELTNSELSRFTSGLKNMAQKGEQIKSASVFYEKSVKASGATPAWNIAQEGLMLYPGNENLLTALNKAANRLLILGRQQQKRNNYAEARSYYNRVLSNNDIDHAINTLASVFNNQLNFNHKPVVFIDAGHGGSDPGAVHNRVNEKTLNLNTSLILKSELELKGYNVIMSRNTDVFLELIERAESANEEIADIFVSVHYNSMGGNGSARGIETFIHHTVASGFGQETKRANFKTNDIRIKESLDLADAIHSKLISSTGMYDRGVKGNNFGVLRNTAVPAVLLELGFMDNSTELSRIRTSSYQRQAAKAVASGIDEYFKYLK